MPKRTSFAPVFPLLGCLALGALAFVLPLREAKGYQGYDHLRYLVAGEQLIHGLPLVGVPYYHPPNADVQGGNSFYHLPASDVAAALLYSHWRLPPRLLQGACALLVALLMLALEGSLGEPALSGLAPAAGLLLYRWTFPQGFLTFYLLVVAGCAALYARKPTHAGAWRLALAIGCSFLFRSSLALLPPLAALLALVTGPGGRSRRAARAAILLVVPYLFTLPVATANWRLHHELIPFENGEASSALVTGALGVVETLEGPWQVLLPDPTDLDGRSILAWAVREVLRHPLRYAAACAARAGHFVAWTFPVLLPALAALWWRRRSPAFAALAALTAYFVGVHCLLSVEPGYFEPLAPLLIVLACSWGGRWRPSRAPLPESLPPRLLDGALAALLLLALYASALTLGNGRASLAQALERSPDDWWLLQQQGEERQRQGDFRGAETSFARAFAVKPPVVSLGHELKSQLATAELFEGRPEPLWRLTQLDFHRHKYDLRCSLGLAYAWLGRGRRDQALEELRSARRKWLDTCYIRGPENARRQDLRDKLCAGRNFPPKAEPYLAEWPADKRASVKALLAGLK